MAKKETKKTRINNALTYLSVALENLEEAERHCEFALKDATTEEERLKLEGLSQRLKQNREEIGRAAAWAFDELAAISGGAMAFFGGASVIILRSLITSP